MYHMTLWSYGNSWSPGAQIKNGTIFDQAKRTKEEITTLVCYDRCMSCFDNEVGTVSPTSTEVAVTEY